MWIKISCDGFEITMQKPLQWSAHGDACVPRSLLRKGLDEHGSHAIHINPKQKHDPGTKQPKAFCAGYR